MSTHADALPEADLVVENPTRVVWTLAWPAVALNSLQVVNTLLDRGFIGHLDAAALTAHGGAMNVMFLMFSLAISVSTGATALVSRFFGAENFDEMRHAARESLSVATWSGIAIGFLTWGIAGFAANGLMPADSGEAQREMIKFLSVYAIGMPAIFVIQTLAGSLRGIGDTRSPMIISGVQIFLHMTMNFLLILPPRQVMGIHVPGAGLGLVGAATSLSGSACLSAVAYVIWVRRTPLGALPAFRLPDREWLMRILRIAGPVAVMSTLRVLSLTAFTLILKRIHNADAAIASIGIGFAIESIMFMPAFGLSAAAGALVGQSLGMKKPDRAERLGWLAAFHGAGVTIALAIPLFVTATPIAFYLVDGKADIAIEAASLLRYLCATEFLFGFAMVLVGAMQGAGDTVRPLWISVVSLWLLRVPIAIFLALPHGFLLGGLVPIPALGMGSNGAWISLSLTQGLQGILALIAFRQGKWKTQKV